MRKLLVNTILMLCLYPCTARAEQYLGVGFQLGMQHDVGNISSYNSKLETDPQNNFLIGLAIKADYKLLFLRTGVGTTILMNKGEVTGKNDPTDTDTISQYRISYMDVPAYIGMNFPVQTVGEFYMGCGMNFFLATGSITHTSKQDISAYAFGYGFILGMQININSIFRLYMEWTYTEGRTGPIMSTTTNAWKNFTIDFSGNRIVLGIMYYII
jgi:opacity protein-like surface antigen